MINHNGYLMFHPDLRPVVSVTIGADSFDCSALSVNRISNDSHSAIDVLPSSWVLIAN